MAITQIKRTLASLGANGEPWLVQAYSANASAAPEELKAAVAGTQHFIRQLKVNYTPGSTAKYWVLVDSNEAEITARVDAIDTGDNNWGIKYTTPLPVGTGHPIRLLTEATGAISVTMEGFSVQARLRADSDYTPASASTSASVSTTPSASISSTPSASLSTSASPSVSSSASDSTSASVSLSPSTSPSASPSVSSTISASPSVSSSTS